MQERIINYDDLPMGSLWDGSPIRRTLNCDGCRFLVKVQRNEETIEICDWGVAWKILDGSEKPSKCQKFGKYPPRLTSSVTIDKLK